MSMSMLVQRRACASSLRGTLAPASCNGAAAVGGKPAPKSAGKGATWDTARPRTRKHR